jgi:amino-acid N-acetyltransferase
MLATTSSRPAISARPTLHSAVALLESVDLPASDLSEGHLEHFFYCGGPGALTALIGLELYGGDALLRSLVVAPGAREQGLGSALVEHAEKHARAQGVRAMYLLTTTAEQFFARRGYQRIARAGLVPAIQATREFRDLCPSSSALMAKAL